MVCGVFLMNFLTWLHILIWDLFYYVIHEYCCTFSYSGWSVPSAVVGGLGNHVLFSLHLTDHTVFSYCFVWSLLFGPFHFLVSSPHFPSPSPQWSTEQLPNLLKSLCAFVIGISVVICENVLHFIIKREESYTVDPWTMWVLGIHPTPLQSKFCM